MTSPAPSSALRHLRYRLLAASALVCAGAAAGQSFQGSASPINGSATVTTATGQTNIQVNAPTAVINWTPFPTPTGSGSPTPTSPIQFQTANTTATFSNAAGVGTYTVLNRVIPGNPSRQIVFSGTVNSTVNGQQGGNVWFYSPGGIVLGAGANFNVGSLLLSTSDVAYNATAGTVDPAQASLLGTASSTAFNVNGTISIAPTASINASNYVAMFAPRIQQDGGVTANGGVAYVAGNAGTLTFPSSNGLFSIAVGDGTEPTDGNTEVLRHNGTTSGAVRSATSTGRGIYFVAVPKNTAITALLGGSIGYQQASGVTTGIDDTVVLTSESATSGSTPSNLSEPGLVGLSATIRNATVRGDFHASVPDLQLAALSGTLAFGGNARLQAYDARIDVNGTGTFTVANDLLINAAYGDPTGSFSRTGGSATAVLAGTTTIGREFRIDASSKATSGSAATGGDVALTVENGTLNVGTTTGSSLVLVARGTGAEGTIGSSATGGVGGNITLNLVNALVNIGRTLGLDTNGYGGPGAIPSPLPAQTPGLGMGYGGEGGGGVITMTASGTTRLTTATGITAYARGYGGSFSTNASGGVFGGQGSGGTIVAELGGALVAAPMIDVNAAGQGGDGQNAIGGDFVGQTFRPRHAGYGGNALGGEVTFNIATWLEANTVTIDAVGTGGRGGTAVINPQFPAPNGNSGNGGKGGDGTGGEAILQVLAGGQLIRGTQATGLTITTGGRGGNGGGSDNGSAGRGGDGAGGFITIQTNSGGGDLTTPRLEANATATGGNAGTTGVGDAYGGDATGGEIAIEAYHGAIRADVIALSSIANRGLGQSRLFGQTAYAVGNPHGGTGRGGGVTITAGDPDNGFVGTIASNSLLIDTYALFTTPETRGSTSEAGAVSITSRRGSNLAFGTARIDTRATSADALNDPGDAIAGTVRLDTDTGGLFAVTGTTTIDARAIGGRSFSTFTNGGDAFGGTVTGTAVSDGELRFGTTTITTNATAGGHAAVEMGGYSAFAGDVTLTAADGGIIRAGGALSISAIGGYNTIVGLPVVGTIRSGAVALQSQAATLSLSGGLSVDSSASQQGALGGSIEIAASGDVGGLAPNLIAGTTLNASGTNTGAFSGSIAIRNTSTGTNADGNNLLRFTSSLSATALGSFFAAEGVGASDAITFEANDARIQVAGPANVSASANVFVSADGTGGIDFLNSATINTYSFDPNHSNRGAGIYTIGGGTVAGSTLTINASDALNAVAGTTIFGNNVVLDGKTVTVDDVTAANAMTIRAFGGDVTAKFLRAGAGGLTVTAPGDIAITDGSVDDTDGDGFITLDSSAGNLLLGTLFAPQSFQGSAAGFIQFGSVSGGNIDFRANGGDITGDYASGGVITFEASGGISIDLDLSTAQFFGYALGGDLFVNSGSGFGIVFGEGSNITLRSDGDIAAQDLAARSNIVVDASNIRLGDGGGNRAMTASGTIDITARNAIDSRRYAITADGSVTIGAGSDLNGGTLTNGVLSDGLAVTSTTGMVDVTAGNSIILGQVTGFESVMIGAGDDITVDQVAATRRAAIAGGADPTHGTVGIFAGLLRSGSVQRGNLTILRSITAPGDIALNAGDSIFTRDNFRVESGNRVTMTAANDIRLAFGAGVRSGLDSASVANAAMTIAAGGLAAPAGVDGPGNVRGLIMDTLLDARAGNITLSGDAIQADAGRIVTSGNVTMTLAGAPGGNGVGNGSVPLRPECGDGIICVGGVEIGGQLTVGSLTNTAVSPLTARFANDVRGREIEVAGGTILFDAGRIIPITATGTAATNFLARTGAISGDAAITAANGTVILDAATDITGAGLRVSGQSVTLDAERDLYLGGGAASAGDLFVNGARNMRFGSLTVARTIRALPSAATPAIQLSGSFAVDGAAALNTSNTAGLSASIRAPGGITFGGAAALGGNYALLLDSVSAPMMLGSVSGSGASLIARGGAITIATLALDTADLDAVGALAVTTDAVANTLLARGGSVTLNAIGALDIDAGLARNGAFTAISGGALTFPTITGNSVILTAGTTLTGGTVNGPNGITLRANGNLTTTTLNAISPAGTPAAITATSVNGALQLGTVTAGGLVTGRAQTGIGFTAVNGGSVDLETVSGNITAARIIAPGTVRVVTGDEVQITDELRSSGATLRGRRVLARNTNGALNITSVTATGGDVTLSARDALTIASGSASGAFTAGSTAGAVTTGPLNSGGPMTLTAATTATLNGPTAATGVLEVTAAGITLGVATSGGTATFRSGAITLGNGATVTSPGLVTFQNTGTRQTQLGGNGGTGYALSASALQQVRSSGITILASAAPEAIPGVSDVVIDTLSLTGAAGTAPVNLASGAAFSVVTPGSIQVIGDARIASAGAGNAIRLNAGRTIGVTLPSGSLAVLDPGGALTGAIDLTAPRITVATTAAANDITAATATATRMSRLATNDAQQVNDRGALAAGQLTFRIRDGLYIQNTGGAARADRRGFNAGSGGVDIIATGTAQPEFVVNGRIGTTVGDAVIAAIRLSGPNNASGASGASLFVGASSANDCTLAQGCPVAAPPPPPPPPPAPPPPVANVPPVQNLVTYISSNPEDEQRVEEVLRAAIPPIRAPLVQIPPADPFSFAPPVDEPVTGSGNDSLWTGIGAGNAADGDGALVGTGEEAADAATTGTGEDDRKAKAKRPSPR